MLFFYKKNTIFHIKFLNPYVTNLYFKPTIRMKKEYTNNYLFENLLKANQNENS
jgi:hypothetical protein